MSLFSRIAKVKRRKHLHFQIANLTLYQMSYGPRHLLY